jgi:hypothetical protein
MFPQKGVAPPTILTIIHRNAILLCVCKSEIQQDKITKPGSKTLSSPFVSPFFHAITCSRTHKVAAALKHCFFLCAGQGPYFFSATCWTCEGAWCEIYGDYARIGNVGTLSNLTTRVNVQGGGPYRLAYTLTHGYSEPNAWRVVVGSVDGSFGSVVLESLTNAPAFPARYTELPFNIPDGTTAVTLTFSGRQVRVLPHDPCLLASRTLGCGVTQLLCLGAQTHSAQVSQGSHSCPSRAAFPQFVDNGVQRRADSPLDAVHQPCISADLEGSGPWSALPGPRQSGTLRFVCICWPHLACWHHISGSLYRGG